MSEEQLFAYLETVLKWSEQEITEHPNKWKAAPRALLDPVAGRVLSLHHENPHFAIHSLP